MSRPRMYPLRYTGDELLRWRAGLMPWVRWEIAAVAQQEYHRCGFLSTMEDMVSQKRTFTHEELDLLLAREYTLDHDATIVRRGMSTPEPDFERAAGGSVCGVCGLPYHAHPYSPFYLAWDGAAFLTRLCSGRLVKL